MGHVGHVDYVCEGCGVRLGGCRCMAENKTEVKQGLCEACKKAKAKVLKMPTPHRIQYINKQDEAFNSLEDLEEYELQKAVHKNLYEYLTKNLKLKYTKEVFQFLVKNSNEVATLLTLGNLETKYQGRTLK